MKTFVVKQENRNEGIGRQLMLEAEKEAKKRNCRYLSLDTFSFQSPLFYEKLGFKKIGTETDFPKGYEKYYYQKKI
ncbi:GNAT family N-acetyltransferase [Mesonia sp. MT50]|uniref:GNAT family N-acetyltransferase n=1 Tax=Mesonia profundi TaxID=3070998 RepID=A0ABU1A265_9FLAO|nr:GNAT family N-acetyltransferase [Mesonia profundi]MDQ7917797.1 GNAT family N-acetyltransferase [Mesonia profundi]